MPLAGHSLSPEGRDRVSWVDSAEFTLIREEWPLLSRPNLLAGASPALWPHVWGWKTAPSSTHFRLFQTLTLILSLQVPSLLPAGVKFNLIPILPAFHELAPSQKAADPNLHKFSGGGNTCLTYPKFIALKLHGYRNSSKDLRNV